MKDLNTLMNKNAEIVNEYISNYFADLDKNQTKEITGLLKSMEYSSTNGGKRFRPVLSLLVGEMLSVSNETLLPFATAVELIHTYSLIHDDLPCMDDDDERRGKATNHKVFGEDIALIAGDGLLTESFFILSSAYAKDPELSRTLTLELSRSAGLRGMVGGQAIDLAAQKEGVEYAKLLTLHKMKTGALIEVSCLGAALIAKTSSDETQRLTDFGALVGLAFQVADDILDYEPENPEKGNFVTLKGIDETKAFLQKTSEEAINCLKPWGAKAANLISIVEFNQKRTK